MTPKLIEYTAAQGLAFIRFQSPPVNALGFALLDELCEAVRRAGDNPHVQGIVVTGGPEHFSAGADLEIFQKIRGGEDAVRTSRIFQEAFQKVEDSAKPVVAAVAGHVLGGALELAMACHFRVAAEGSRFSMPEVRLGINPGAGGTQRLPRLVGVEAALDILLTAQPIDARRALALGLIDAVCQPEMLVPRAAEILQSASKVPRTSRHVEKLAETAAQRAAFAKADQRAAAGRPEIIAPGKIVEAVRVGVEESFQAGLLREQEAFKDCMATLATQNKIYVFCASRKTGRIDRLPAPPSSVSSVGPFCRKGLERQTDVAGAQSPARQAGPTKAAVLGMGTMGTGIAQALIAAGIAVVACDE
ncbi:MAG: enoyl-CoA hydratase-related protein, partial [Thermoguttaceae bacterium]